MKNIEIKDNSPGTPSDATTRSVKIFIGINIFIDDTITFNPYNTTKANIILVTTFLTILNIISFP